MLLDELAAHLQAESIGVVGTDLFKGRMPDTPDSALTLYEYGGLAPTHVYGLYDEDGRAERLLESPRVQLMARGGDYAVTRQWIEDAMRALDLAGETLTGLEYVRVAPVESPFLLDQDANGRWRFVVNVQVEKVPALVV